MGRVEKFFADKFSMEKKAIEFVVGQRDNNISDAEIIENEAYKLQKELGNDRPDLVENVFVLSMIAHDLNHKLYLLNKDK